MPNQPKPQPKKLGRPVLPKHEAKGKIVPVRFRAEDLEKMTEAAKKNGQTVSEWIRTTLDASLQNS